MLPLHLGDEEARASTRLWRRVQARCRRIWKNVTHLRELDLEGAGWLMLNLCIAPSKVMRNTAWHKQTKGQWARDDPAFLIIQVLFMITSCITWSIGFSPSFWMAIWAIFKLVVFHFFFAGAVIATVCWLVATYSSDNSNEIVDTPAAVGPSGSSSAWVSYFRNTLIGRFIRRSRVEWAYCFDVHCNSFFPFFMLVHVCAYIVAPFLLSRNFGFVATVMANTFITLAAVYYCYITFLGYQTLGSLRDARVFLIAIPTLVIFMLSATLFGINILAFGVHFVYG